MLIMIITIHVPLYFQPGSQGQGSTFPRISNKNSINELIHTPLLISTREALKEASFSIYSYLHSK